MYLLKILLLSLNQMDIIMYYIKYDEWNCWLYHDKLYVPWKYVELVGYKYCILSISLFVVQQAHYQAFIVIGRTIFILQCKHSYDCKTRGIVVFNKVLAITFCYKHHHHCRLFFCCCSLGLKFENAFNDTQIQFTLIWEQIYDYYFVEILLLVL